MKRFGEIFRLTSAEQRVVVMVGLALLAVAILQKHRERIEGAVPRPSSNPGAATPSVAEGE